MMRNLLAFIGVFLSFGLFGQTLVSTPGELSGEFEACPGNSVIMEFEVTNTLAEDVSALWMIKRVDFPDQWQVQVCDNFTCYGWEREDCPEDRPNDFLANQSWDIYSVKVRIPAEGWAEEGIGDLDFVMFNAQDSTDVYMTVPIVATGTACTSSADDLEDVSDLNIYPNPTSDVFKINRNEAINKISIYNIVGKEVKSFKKSANGTYNISDLNNGMYLVRMFNESGDLLKVSRLSKR